MSVLSVCPNCARFTFTMLTVQRVSSSDIWKVPFHLGFEIPLKWVICHVTFSFACRAQDYTFCLLIVRYMLSVKIKGKKERIKTGSNMHYLVYIASRLKARTFLLTCT